MSFALRCALALAASTWLEAVRNRVLLVSVSFIVALIGLSITTAAVSMGDQARLIIDVGLAAASALGGVMTIALTLASFAREIEQRTAFPVLVRPLPRWAFVLGKYLGVVATMLVVVSLMVLATAVSVWIYGGTLPAAFWPSLYLAWLEVAVVGAIALAFSCFTTPVLAATYSAALWLAGSFAGDILALADTFASKGMAAAPVVRLAYYFVPDLEALSLRTQAANALPVPAAFVGWATVYSLAYAAFALLVAMILFTRRRAV